MKKFLIILVVVCFCSTGLFSEISEKINVQGFYEDIFRNPVTILDNFDLEFTIIDQADTPVWTTNMSGLTCNDGYYSVVLDIPQDTLNPENTYFLITDVENGDAVATNEIMSSPYTYYAKQVEWATFKNNSMIFTNGNVGIDVAIPIEKLEVNGNTIISGFISANGGNSLEWNTAYSWGNHASVGYLTSYTETDPVFSASAAIGITAGNIANWNTAYSWGNHASAGYLQSGSLINATGGLIIETRTSDPASPATGQIWLRTDL